MNDEIKEILNRLEKIGYYASVPKELAYMTTNITPQECKTILDYITDLQEELEEEKRINQENLKLIDKLEEKTEKASGLIEPLVEWGECTINGKILKNVYDILNEGDE